MATDEDAAADSVPAITAIGLGFLVVSHSEAQPAARLGARGGGATTQAAGGRRAAPAAEGVPTNSCGPAGEPNISPPQLGRAWPSMGGHGGRSHQAAERISPLTSSALASQSKTRLTPAQSHQLRLPDHDGKQRKGRAGEGPGTWRGRREEEPRQPEGIKEGEREEAGEERKQGRRLKGAKPRERERAVFEPSVPWARGGRLVLQPPPSPHLRLLHLHNFLFPQANHGPFPRPRGTAWTGAHILFSSFVLERFPQQLP